jgi:anthranilate synthase component 1
MWSTTIEQDVARAGQARAQGAALLPVVRELPADTVAPMTAYLRLRGRAGGAFLLESVVGGEHLGRYSFVGAEPFAVLGADAAGAYIQTPAAGRQALPGNPHAALGAALDRWKVLREPGLPPFLLGAVGYLSYETVHWIEPRVPLRHGVVPLALLPLFGTVVAFDHLLQHLFLIRAVELNEPSGDRALVEQAHAHLDALAQELVGQPPGPWLASPSPDAHAHLSLGHTLGQAGYEAGVRTLKRAIRAGDIFQAVLSEAFPFSLHAEPVAVYRALRALNPSPYMFCIELDEVALVGASPEMLVRVDGGHVETRPIAGTRRRGPTEEEDAKLAAQLMASVKERAEHLMLVDLGRNDLGRVCKGGTVRVPSFMSVERYSHVMHIVSSVKGQLAPGRRPWEALAACFPAGTVSGAPKIQAMQMLAELEPRARGPYAGAVIYADLRGNLDSAIAIRCMVVGPKRPGPRDAYLQAGAGVVYDSSPTREWEEVQNKARALARAVAWAESVRASEFAP